MTPKELIKRLNTIKDEKKLVKIINKPLQELFFYILYDIAKLQAPDTSQARMNIIRKVADALGTTYKQMADNLIETYYYWENHGYPENNERNWDNVSQSKVIMKSGVFKWTSTDEGIIAQEFDRKGSDFVTDMAGNKREGYFPKGHISIVASAYDNDSMPYNIIIDKRIKEYITKYIETGVYLNE